MTEALFVGFIAGIVSWLVILSITVLFAKEDDE
jgi:hypothetical protein